MRIKTFLLLLTVLITFVTVRASDFRMRAMGGVRLALPDADNKLNLYRYAANMAGLQNNDSTDWMKFRYNSASAWGELRRRWDSAENDLFAFAFSGQKQISRNQLFYGRVQYDVNYRKRLSNAIEPEPYALDPFVLTDSTTGNFVYSGPHVYAAYNHHLFKNMWWSASLDYQISRGLKDVYTRPEIIRRTLRFGLDMLYKLSPSWRIGFSFRPYDINELTKLVRQPDGQDPRVRRYRGEFVFKEILGGSDRTAKYSGYETGPQLAFDSPRLKGVFSAFYYYRWLELFDGTAVQNYDGYYQGTHYSLNTVWRYYPTEGKTSVLAFGYNFAYISDWAKEPVAGFEIYRAFYHQHRIIAGFSCPWENLPLTTSTEIQFKYVLPDRRDYLAHIMRRGSITDAQLHMGAEWHVNRNKSLQAGCVLQQYHENSVWRYFGNYRGAALTFGSTYQYAATIVELYGYFGRLSGQTYGQRQRNRFNFFLQIKQFIN